MTDAQEKQEETVLAALISRLEETGSYNPDDQVAPAVILWTDEGRQWESIVSYIRDTLPHFLTLGEYEPEGRTGPAIWVRCMLARELPAADWDDDTVPVLYMPGVSRKQLRDVEECPEELQPLLELQYRGVFFTQYNARDWTIRAFLESDRGGLNLDVARDQDTTEAMELAILRIASTPVERLQGRHLEESDFNELLVPDPNGAVLQWLDDPEKKQAEWAEEKWRAFRNVCQNRLGFDPEVDGELVGAEKLGCRDGAWSSAWERYAEAPENYESLPDRLAEVEPSYDLFTDQSSWPQRNEKQEDNLRQALKGIADANDSEIRSTLKELERKHGSRRDWVWAELGKSPLAQALEPLCALASSTEDRPGGSSVEELGEAYVKEGWKTDWAVLEALACVEAVDDMKVVSSVLRSLYLPWLEAATTEFQRLCAEEGLPDVSFDSSSSGTCFLFADGLRFDVAQKLNEVLTAAGLNTTLDFGWAAAPPVTGTSKYAASPIRDQLSGDSSAEKFKPQVTDSGSSVTAQSFRKMLEETGYQVLAEDETGDTDATAWTEHGSLDRYGHEQGCKLAWRIEEELRGLRMRVWTLLEAGWDEVRIITDHGWLLMPGALPKAELAKCLTETPWRRCATLKPGNTTDYVQYPWFWNSDVTVVSAPDVRCFRKGVEYDHGGLSLQECLVPRITVRAPTDMFEQACIEDVGWAGLRCRTTVSGAITGGKVDIRTRVNDPSSSIASPEAINDEGKASILVEDDSLIDTAAHIVLLDSHGKVVDKEVTTIGGR